jgi:hypothetical protein
VKRALQTLTLVSLLAVVGCFTYPVAATVVTQPARRVSASVIKFSFLWLTPLPLETASDLMDELIEQCDGAGVTGVTTAVNVGFAVIGQQERMLVSGYCAEPGQPGPGGQEP